MAIGLLTLILAITWYSFSTRNQEPVQVFSATVNRDCAPWDGSAFTVSIPMSDGTIVDISIWQAPDIKFSVTFSFLDNTGQVGNAALLLPVGLPAPLTGTVLLQRVEPERPVEGAFDLKDESGKQFKGEFKAEWDNQIVMCG